MQPGLQSQVGHRCSRAASIPLPHALVLHLCAAAQLQFTALGHTFSVGKRGLHLDVCMASWLQQGASVAHRTSTTMRKLCLPMHGPSAATASKQGI